MDLLRESSLAATSACCSCLFTNPLEVVKTRMQVQGELARRGSYVVHYKNVAQGLLAIGKCDGIKSLQCGIVPALYYQVIFNGVRLGIYQLAASANFTTNFDGSPNFVACAVAGGVSGGLGAACAAPAYLVKTQLQVSSNSPIAVGTQHNHNGACDALVKIVRTSGWKGLWRGGLGSTIRLSLGSGVQLATYSSLKSFLEERHMFNPGSASIPLVSSAGGIGVALLIATPFDVITTRLCNQPLDSRGKGTNYKGIVDCAMKIHKFEGPRGFYKGLVATYIRVGPHAVLTLVFWELLRSKYHTGLHAPQNAVVPVASATNNL